ncbi:MAG: ATP-grasp domain-containing protein [Bacteroidales bacterium]|nr:ATP-grasp domain-containing protein [Bacteroidales bacterium]
MLFLIDKPFVSDFLIKTMKENGYRVVSTPVAREMIKDDSLTWISEELAADIIEKDPHTPLYTNSENALTWIAGNTNGSELSDHIQLFKDKARFRELILTLFPGFFYTTVKLDDIQYLSLEGIPKPFVIKPSVGFFSLGVHIVRNQSDWNRVKNELSISKLEGIYPPSVLNTSTFIIEEYINGEEFAVDCYFNHTGEVVILNILHHRFSSGTDTSDRVYTTSKEIVLKYKDSFEAFLNAMGKAAGIRNFPAHVELRMDASGKINPIEVNPLRFGGWCTTGDLPGLALGYNLYEYYYNMRKPDWEKIFENRADKIYSIVVLNNNSGLSPADIKGFDYDLLGEDFENALMIRKLDIKEYPVFGFLFAETSAGNEEELTKILVSDLKKYINPG